MRVGVNTLFYIPGEVGGSETYLRKTLCAIANNYPDLEIVLFTNIENDATLRADARHYPHISFHQIDVRATNRYSRILHEQFALPLGVRREHIDVLWSPGYTPCCACPCPQVTSILDMQYKSHPEDLSWLARITTNILVKAACRYSSTLITISEFSKFEIARYCRAEPTKITVTPLAVDPQFAKPASPEDIEDARLVMGLEDSTPFILSIANSYPHKNLHTLVRAFNTLTKTVPHRLILVGKPRLGEPELAEACSEANDCGRILRIDRVEETVLTTLLQTADLFVFPSLYEGFGLPVLEAMMAGTQVITTRRASLPEVGGEYATYVEEPCSPTDFAAAIDKALTRDTSRAEQRTASARDWATGFRWDSTAAKTVDVLRKAACV
jgi:glycosyltransferase involved in cell wall biosynthesis